MRGVVLDAGCGNGCNEPALAGRARLVVGLDSSSELLQLAGVNCRELVAAGRVQFVAGDFRKLELVAWPAQFDSPNHRTPMNRTEPANHALKGAGSVGFLESGEGVFDCVLCLGAFHHLRSEAGRRAALRGFRRALKPGGRLCIVVWNRLQEKFSAKGRDAFVPWRGGVRRYYHFFTPGELAGLVKRAGFARVETLFEKAGAPSAGVGAHNLVLFAVKPRG